ncbi:unnamed protein product, partial [Staurois parvus]
MVITMCGKIGGNILCSVFCPSEYLENALHSFFMMKKGSGQHWELEDSICSVYKRSQAFFHLKRLIKSTAKRKFLR